MAKPVSTREILFNPECRVKLVTKVFKVPAVTQSKTTIELQPRQHLHPLAHYYQNIDVNQTSNQILFKTALFLLFLVSQQNLFHSIHCSEPFRMSTDAGNWMQFLTVLCFSSEKVEDQEKTRPVYSCLSNYITGRTLNSKVTCSFQLWPPSGYSLGHSPPPDKSH